MKKFFNRFGLLIIVVLISMESILYVTNLHIYSLYQGIVGLTIITLISGLMLHIKIRNVKFEKEMKKYGLDPKVIRQNIEQICLSDK
jgi:hypothetical protein